jgi:hypothetical protein
MEDGEQEVEVNSQLEGTSDATTLETTIIEVIKIL